MEAKTIAKLLANWPQFRLLTGIMKDAQKLHRMTFVATAFEEGVYQAIGEGTTSLEGIAKSLALSNDHQGLKAWLDLGVSLGELSKDENGYRISGRLSKRLLAPQNDSVLAVLQEIVTLQSLYIRQTPQLLREDHRLPMSTIDAPMIARGSRTLELFASEAVEQIVPKRGPVRLLEVGCGSGIYMRQACQINPSLSALGLELDEKVAAMARNNLAQWGLDQRSQVKVISILEFETDEPIDLITLHNNIYYFPMVKRIALLQRLLGMLRPGGKLLITSGCSGGSNVMMQALNLECAMTESMGTLPDVEELLGQLTAAGFINVRRKRLMPFAKYYAFLGERGN